jgi:hypothetical protein
MGIGEEAESDSDNSDTFPNINVEYKIRQVPPKFGDPRLIPNTVS